ADGDEREADGFARRGIETTELPERSDGPTQSTKNRTDGWTAALRSPDRLGQMPLALAMSLERSPAFRAQAGIVQSLWRDRTEGRGGGQQRAAQGAVRRGGQHQLPGYQVHPRLVAGEQIQLFVRLDRLIGMQGPGAARHGRLRKGGATLAER